MVVLSPELREYSVFADRLADAARSETLPRFRAQSAVANKAGPWFDPVTDADREAERVLRSMIKAVYPAHGVIGEEFGTENPGADRRWVLDPVDGTRAFICGAPSWATLIALEISERPVVGVIDQPFTNERWRGCGGEAFYRRDDAELGCRTSGVSDLKRARLSTTDPRPTENFTSTEAAAFTDIANAALVTRFSLDAYAYGLLAIGELDLVVEAGLKRHDFSALVPVVEGAGGVITDWRGEKLGSDERGRIVAAASADLHAAALEKLKLD